MKRAIATTAIQTLLAQERFSFFVFSNDVTQTFGIGICGFMSESVPYRLFGLIISALRHEVLYPFYDVLHRRRSSGAWFWCHWVNGSGHLRRRLPKSIRRSL